MSNHKYKVYYSYLHKRAATHFIAAAREEEENKMDFAQNRLSKPHTTIPFYQHKVFVINSIFSAAAFFESVINEIYLSIYDNEPYYTSKLKKSCIEQIKSYWQTYESNYHSTSILTKYNNILTYSGSTPYKKNHILYKKANNSIYLRNELTHYKPKYFNKNEQHPLLKNFNSKKFINPLFEKIDDQYSLNKILSAETANFVLNCYINFLKDFSKRFKIKLHGTKLHSFTS